MDFSVLGFKAEAIAIPVLYVETGLYPKTMDMAKTRALYREGLIIVAKFINGVAVTIAQ